MIGVRQPVRCAHAQLADCSIGVLMDCWSDSAWARSTASHSALVRQMVFVFSREPVSGSLRQRMSAFFAEARLCSDAFACAADGAGFSVAHPLNSKTDRAVTKCMDGFMAAPNLGAF